MIFTAANNYNYAKLFNNYCLLAINRNIMSFTTLIVVCRSVVYLRLDALCIMSAPSYNYNSMKREDDAGERSESKTRDYADYLSRNGAFLHPVIDRNRSTKPQRRSFAFVIYNYHLIDEM